MSMRLSPRHSNAWESRKQRPRSPRPRACRGVKSMPGHWPSPDDAMPIEGRQSRRVQSGRAAFKRGHKRERRAAWWLRLKGYRILAINWRSPVGEIDLIARRGAYLAVIEVKQRADTEAAA